VVGTLRKRAPGDFQLNLTLRNMGKQNFGPNEIYAHVFASDALAPKNLTGVANASPMMIDGTAYTDFVSLMTLPCFPGRATDLFDLRLGFDALEDRSVLFFLSTAYGFFPRRLKVLEDGSVAVRVLVLSPFNVGTHEVPTLPNTRLKLAAPVGCRRNAFVNLRVWRRSLSAIR